MMLGIYTIQDFLQYYMRDVIGAAHPEQATTNFLILVSLTSLVSAFIAGWLSDHFGRKRLVYLSGAFMLLVGFIFVFTHSFVIVMVAGMLFGLGYGAYQSVDWALVAMCCHRKKIMHVIWGSGILRFRCHRWLRQCWEGHSSTHLHALDMLWLAISCSLRWLSSIVCLVL